MSSAIDATSTSSSHALPSALKFSGLDAQFPAWKLRMLGYLGATGLRHVLDEPNVLPGKASTSGATDGAAAKVKTDDSSSSPAVAADVDSKMANLKFEEGGSPDDDVKVLSVTTKSERDAKKVYALLLQALADGQLVLVMDVPEGNAKEVWARLLKRYQRTSTANKAVVYGRFLQLKMNVKEGESVDRYVARLKNMKMELMEMGEAVQDGVATHVLLSGLPKSWGPLVQAITLQQMEFDEIVMHLVDYQEKERIKESEEDAEATSEAAHFIGRGGGRPMSFGSQHRHGGGHGQGGGSGASRFGSVHQQGGGGARGSYQGRPSFGGNTGARVSCFNCGKAGHMSRECRSPKTCFNCGRAGHVRAQCDSPQNGGGSATAMSAVQHHAGGGGRSSGRYHHRAGVDDDEEEVAWSAMTPTSMSLALHGGEKNVWATNANGVRRWCLDSGASRHLTCEKEAIKNASELTPPMPLHVANGDAIALTSSGTVTLPGVRGVTVKLDDVGYGADLATNLLSVSCITKAGYSVAFTDEEAIVRDATSGKVVMRAMREGKLYVVEQQATSDDSEREEATETAYGAREKKETEAIVPENGVRSL